MLGGEGEPVQVFSARSHHAEAGGRGSWAPACSEPGPPMVPFCLRSVFSPPGGAEMLSQSPAQPRAPALPGLTLPVGGRMGASCGCLRMVKRDRPSVWLWGAQGQ